MMEKIDWEVIAMLVLAFISVAYGSWWCGFGAFFLFMNRFNI